MRHSEAARSGDATRATRRWPVNVGIVVFPGSNCDADAYHAIRDVLGQHAQYVWHEERSLRGLDAVILPGGFSYGDYLRAGAIATTAPAVRALRPYVERGGLVLGICNGFQTLLEAGLLPGAMLPNLCGEFRCEFVHIRTERADTPFTCALEPGDVLRIPIAHAEGRYVMDRRAPRDRGAPAGRVPLLRRRPGSWRARRIRTAPRTRSRASRARPAPCSA